MYAKPLTFLFENQDVTVELGSSIKKEDLYGKKSTLVEKDGESLEKVLVTPRGDIIEASGTSSIKVDSWGSPVEDITACSAENGQPVHHASSFKEVRTLEKGQEEDIVTLCTESVYPLSQHTLDKGIYKTKFAYRDGPKLQDAVLIINPDSNSFLLVGETRQPSFIGQSETYEFFDAEEDNLENSDEMSFEMF